MNEKVTSKSVMREISSSSQNECLAGLLRELMRFSFSAHKITNMFLAAGLRPDPLGGVLKSPRNPSRSGCHGRQHSLAAVIGALCGEEGGVEVRGRGGDE